MESNDELKEIDIKNRTCYYFDDITRVENFYCGHGLLDEKLYENLLIYDISYKIFMGTNPLRIRSGKVDGFISVYDGTGYLALICSKRYDAIYDIIRYLISKKVVLHILLIIIDISNFAKIKIVSYNSLPKEKA